MIALNEEALSMQVDSKKRKASDLSSQQALKRTANGSLTPLSSPSDSEMLDGHTPKHDDPELIETDGTGTSQSITALRRNAPRASRKKSIVNHLKAEMAQRKTAPRKKKPAPKKDPAINGLEESNIETADTKSIKSVTVAAAKASHKEVNNPLSETKPAKTEADPEPQATMSVSIDVLKTSSAKKQASAKKQTQSVKTSAGPVKKKDSSVEKETATLPAGSTTTAISVKNESNTTTTSNQTQDVTPSADYGQNKPRKRTVAVPPPPLTKVESQFPTRILWAKLCIRDFVLRFDRYAKIPSRFNTALDDITTEWDDRMYKSIVTVCMKFLVHDKSEPLTADPVSVDHYFAEIERTVGNIEKVIRLVDEFLLKNSFIEKSILYEPIDVEQEDGFGQEYRFLHVLNTLVGVAGQTSIVRNAFNDLSQQIRASTTAMNQEIEKAEDAFDKLLIKIRASRKEVNNSPPMYLQPKTSEPRKTKREQLQDLMAKEVAGRAARNRRIAKANKVLNFQTRKLAQRTRPLGTDHYGNTYWQFQPRSVDVNDWGWWIVVEKNSAMPNSLQQPVRRNGAATVDDDEQPQQQQPAATSQPVKSRNKLTVSDPGTGELYYFEITTENLKKCLDWLEYQERLYATYKNGGRKHKLLSSGLDTETSIARIIRSLRMLQPSEATFRN
ncbi:hypothetical protein D0Z00_000936 [Geotrichum galactomycetum]|uniref:Uncharacterized protein n=1 Tax=Geotrichum galactomycetum TaxID=27317 RepID=A0ACB6V8D9_9ASCO|nr:hypothetical protein D0Z00_000936 [Geotrichum candidum]